MEIRWPVIPNTDTASPPAVDPRAPASGLQRLPTKFRKLSRGVSPSLPSLPGLLPVLPPTAPSARSRRSSAHEARRSSSRRAWPERHCPSRARLREAAGTPLHLTSSGSRPLTLHPCTNSSARRPTSVAPLVDLIRPPRAEATATGAS
jgi:hypothetical protein